MTRLNNYDIVMKLINILQVVIAIGLITTILMQNRGSGLSGLFGGGGGGNVYATKRGLEKKLFNATVALAVMFFIVSPNIICTCLSLLFGSIYFYIKHYC